MQESVRLEANGEVYYLRYSINSIIQAEEETGIDISKEQSGIAGMRAMLYAGLLWQDKQMTLDKAGDILQTVLIERDGEYLAERIKKANEVSFGKKIQAPTPKPHQEKKIQKQKKKKR